MYVGGVVLLRNFPFVGEVRLAVLTRFRERAIRSYRTIGRLWARFRERAIRSYRTIDTPTRTGGSTIRTWDFARWWKQSHWYFEEGIDDVNAHHGCYGAAHFIPSLRCSGLKHSIHTEIHTLHTYPTCKAYTIYKVGQTIYTIHLTAHPWKELNEIKPS